MSSKLSNSVIEIDYNIAKTFIEKWHYSKTVPKGSHIFFGWLFNEELYAVSDFGNGVNTYQSAYLSRVTGEPVTNDNMLELKRLCRIEPKKKIYLTQFISMCHKLLKRRGYKYIVSFSDPEHGHNGGIYKAANFIHLGKTNPEYHVIDKDGNIRHRRYPYRYAKSNNCSMDEARKMLGLKIIKTLPKDRWFIKL